MPAAGLGEGDRGPQVAALEQWLTALHYDVAVVDDLFDADTGFAVVAFQKVANLPRTGRATQDVVDALTTATPPLPLVPDGGGDRFEVDLPRQVLFLYEGDALARILPVSTGSGERSCSDGNCREGERGTAAGMADRKCRQVSSLARCLMPPAWNLVRR